MSSTTLHHLLGYYNTQALHLTKKYLWNLPKKCSTDEIFKLIAIRKQDIYPRGRAFRKTINIENEAKYRKVKKLRALIDNYSGMEPEGK